MSKVIYKYPLSQQGASEVKIPRGATLRHAGHQGGQLTVWAEVDPDETEWDTWHFQVVGTGHIYPDEAQYFYTWPEGQFIWHLICMVEPIPQPAPAA